MIVSPCQQVLIFIIDVSFRRHRAWSRGFDIAIGELEERRPVRRIGMPGAVLAECDVAVDQRGFDRREFRGAEVAFAEEAVYWTGAGGGEERSLRVHPCV